VGQIGPNIREEGDLSHEDYAAKIKNLDTLREGGRLCVRSKDTLVEGEMSEVTALRGEGVEEVTRHKLGRLEEPLLGGAKVCIQSQGACH